MPSIACLTTRFALTAFLLCGGTILVGTAEAQPAEQREASTGETRERPRSPPSDASRVELVSYLRRFRQQCRIYFGCPPTARAATGTVQQR